MGKREQPWRRVPPGASVAAGRAEEEAGEQGSRGEGGQGEASRRSVMSMEREGSKGAITPGLSPQGEGRKRQKD